MLNPAARAISPVPLICRNLELLGVGSPLAIGLIADDADQLSRRSAEAVMRELYNSPNGDRWYLAREVDLGQVFIRHEPNLPSGGKAANIEIGAFLSQSGQGPEYRELLRLIGTLVKRDDSSAEGTAPRIKSHAKSYIVE